MRRQAPNHRRDKTTSRENPVLVGIPEQTGSNPGQNAMFAEVGEVAIDALAGSTVIDAVAIALVEAALGAEPPDRVLDEAREGFGVVGIECPSIELVGHRRDDRGTPARTIALGTIGMIAT